MGAFCNVAQECAKKTILISLFEFHNKEIGRE
jgi:hypothetical protein